jgi:amidase
LALGLGAGGVAVPAAAAPTAPLYGDPLVSLAGIDLQAATIPQLQAAMVDGRITSRELTQRYLDRIAFFDHGCLKIDAVRALADDPLAQADAADRARRAGRTGPLLGIPILLKDNVGTTDADTTAGSIALAGNRPPSDAFLVTRLRAAGAVILGKTNLSEFANWTSEPSSNGYSSLGGQVEDPYTTTAAEEAAGMHGDPSGSSSGSGAGGTLAYAAATIGTETSGSILSPSAANSMVGIKPTVGLVSRSGIIPLAHSFDTAGPIARNVTDAAALLTAIAAPGADPSDAIYMEAGGAPAPGHDYTADLDPHALQGARIGYSMEDVTVEGSAAGRSAAAQTVFQQALTDLQAAGATLVEFDTLSNTSNIGTMELANIFSEFHFGIDDYLLHEAGPVGPHGRPMLSPSDDLTGIIVYNQQNSSKFPNGQNLLIASDAAPGLMADDPASAATITTARAAIDTDFSRNNIAAYVGPDAGYAGIGAPAGYPSIDVPIGYAADGTGGTQAPVGLEFLGQAWSEPTLIKLAYSFEQATHRRVPATALNSDLAGCRAAGTSGATPSPRPTTTPTPAPTAHPTPAPSTRPPLPDTAATAGRLAPLPYAVLAILCALGLGAALRRGPRRAADPR